MMQELHNYIELSPVLCYIFAKRERFHDFIRKALNRPMQISFASSCFGCLVFCSQSAGKLFPIIKLRQKSIAFAKKGRSLLIQQMNCGEE